MYLPRDLISHLYVSLLRNYQPLSAPVLILPALEPDALCACRILSALLKRDFIPHKTQPISGYADLARAGEELVGPMRTQSGGSGGVVICIGVGGLVDLGELLGLDTDGDDEHESHGVEVWVVDARRPWNLSNVFGGTTTRPPLAGTDGNRRLHDHGVEQGRIRKNYKPGRGGIVVFDDGDIEEELIAERNAYCALAEMPEVDGDEADDDEADSEVDSEVDEEEETGHSKKRKSWSDRDQDTEDSDDDVERPRQRRRSNSGSSIASPRRSSATDSSRSSSPDSTSHSMRAPKQPSARTLRKRLRALRLGHETVLRKYYALGTSYSEPVSSLLYSLASELGREDNDLLWLAIVGCASLELSGHTSTGISISTASSSGGSAGWGGVRGERIRQILRDEVRRLNPPDPNKPSQERIRGDIHGVIPTTAKSPTDKSIRLSPEPRFLLIRHWSLYDSMLHSPYLATRLHIWNDTGRKRLNKLLAKMGISLAQCRQSYTHMDMELKKDLRSKLLKYSPMYGLEGLVPPVSSAGLKEGWGFVRSWGWKACLSATDVGVILGAILEVGRTSASASTAADPDASQRTSPEHAKTAPDYLPRFWHAYDALAKPETLVASIPLAQHLAKAILRSGTSLLEKKQIRHLRAFRMGVVNDGPDVTLFTNPGALVKLALWVGEAVAVQEREKDKRGKGGTPLVLAAIDERRGVYVIVGTGGGGGVVDFEGLRQRKEARLKKKEEKDKRRREREERKAKKAAERAENSDYDDEANESPEEESEDDEEDTDDEDDEQTQRRGYGRNRFGIAFQEVVDETNARVRIDSFDHSVVEVRKEDLGGFLESLSMKTVVGR